MILSQFLPDKLFLKWKYKRRFGKKLDLEYPKTFSEKMQWLKLYDRSPLHTQCVDKYNVRAYIANRIGKKYLVPLFLHTEDPNDIRSENLPDYPVIIKPTHDSAGSIVVRDKTAVDWKDIRKKLKRSLKRNFYYVAREWQYKYIKPALIVEQLLLDSKGNIPYEYKFHCFNGKVEYIQVFINKTIQSNTYNTNWELQPIFWPSKKPKIDFPLTPPPTLDEMLYLAKILSEKFMYVRVDMYSMADKIYFGELTFHDAAGFEVFNEGFDELFGNLLKLSKV